MAPIAMLAFANEITEYVIRNEHHNEMLFDGLTVVVPPSPEQETIHTIIPS